MSPSCVKSVLVSLDIYTYNLTYTLTPSDQAVSMEKSLSSLKERLKVEARLGSRSLCFVCQRKIER